MVATTALLKAKPGREEELERVLRTLESEVRANEPGCESWRPLRSRHDPRLYLLVERYADDEALAAHANSSHYIEAIPSLMDCLEEPPRLAIFGPLGDEG